MILIKDSVRDGKIQQTGKSGSLTIPESSVVLDAAEFLGAENEMGTITSGKQANLVLLNANPLEDIKNTTRIEGIVLNREWLPDSFFD